MRRLTCRWRGHPLDETATLDICPCGRAVWVDSTDPAAQQILRIRAANTSSPHLAAMLTAAADYLQETT